MAIANMSAIRAMAFDLDGTLTDSLPGLARALDQALYALELPPAGAGRATDWIGNGVDVLLAKALHWARQQKSLATCGKQATATQQAIREATQETTAESVITAATDPSFTLPENHAPDKQQQMLRQLFDHYYQTAALTGSVLYPGVAHTLATLHARGIPLALVTNKPRQFIRPLLQAVGIDSHFSLIFGGDDVIQKKPHPAAIFLVLGQLGILPEQLLFVGDSRNDILAAQAAGCPCVGMSYGYNYGEPIAQSQPDQVLDHFADLLTLLDGAPCRQQ